jgi:ATP-binding protein involved in chromosome partitioning
MTQATKEQILAALSAVIDPETRQNIVAAGLVTGLVVRDGQVGFALEVDPTLARTKEPMRLAAEKAALSVPGVVKATVVLTAERPPEAGAKPSPAQTTAGAGPAAKGQGMARVKKVVAVASGKGGVGKSTVSVNLALGLSALGLKVGLLDADIYGPSIPRMLGLTGKPETDGEMLKPKHAYGLKAMSIGLLVDVDTAMIWRGPMATSALQQMMSDVAWGELDVMIVDMPPGTGDIQLTMAQRTPLAGGVIVSTPQDIALIDARKGIGLFKKTNVPILGLIENMSYFVCTSCGTRHDIFGHGGARETAHELGAPFLGEIPLHMAIRQTSDDGRPIVATEPASAQAQAFLAVAGQVAQAIAGATLKAPPKLSFRD